MGTWVQMPRRVANSCRMAGPRYTWPERGSCSASDDGQGHRLWDCHWCSGPALHLEQTSARACAWACLGCGRAVSAESLRRHRQSLECPLLIASSGYGTPVLNTSNTACAIAAESSWRNPQGRRLHICLALGPGAYRRYAGRLPVPGWGRLRFQRGSRDRNASQAINGRRLQRRKLQRVPPDQRNRVGIRLKLNAKSPHAADDSDCSGPADWSWNDDHAAGLHPPRTTTPRAAC